MILDVGEDKIKNIEEKLNIFSLLFMILIVLFLYIGRC